MSYNIFFADQMLTLEGAQIKQGRKITEDDLTLITQACLIENKGVIEWVGKKNKIPKELIKKIKKFKTKEINLGHKTLIPGFVECHTHLVFSGSRAHEFELRNNGLSYQEIAARGGGILSTMRNTRKSNRNELLALAQKRIAEFVSQGVTSLEIKTGYALNLKDELKCLEIIKELSDKSKNPRIISTFLGAHAKPPEFSTYEDYLVFLEEKLLPQIKKKKLSNRVDIFIEAGFFQAPEAKKYLEAAKALGFDLTIHADQLSLSGGTSLAVELGARSADHVIQIGSKEIKKLSESTCTSVLLPLADLYMRCSYPPARMLIDSGARVALATDFNPGSSPSQDLAMVGLLARLEMKMTLPEVICAYTLGAAYALGLQDQVGSLCVGKSADFVSIESDWTELFYSAGKMGIRDVFLRGKKINS